MYFQSLLFLNSSFYLPYLLASPPFCPVLSLFCSLSSLCDIESMVYSVVFFFFLVTYVRAGGFRSLADFSPSLLSSFPPSSLSHFPFPILTCVLPWFCLRVLWLYTQRWRQGETDRERGSIFLLFCLVHMFIVVELPEIDLKAVTTALDSDRESSPMNTVVPLLNTT